MTDVESEIGAKLLWGRDVTQRQLSLYLCLPLHHSSFVSTLAPPRTATGACTCLHQNGRCCLPVLHCKCDSLGQPLSKEVAAVLGLNYRALTPRRLHESQVTKLNARVDGVLHDSSVLLLWWIAHAVTWPPPRP